MTDNKTKKPFPTEKPDTVSDLTSLIIDKVSKFVTYPALTNDYGVVKEILKDCLLKLERVETEALGKKLL